MARTDGSDDRRALMDVAERFRTWRRTRKHGEKIPLSLWQVAVELAGQYALDEIAVTLALDRERLNKRIETTAHRRSRASGTPLSASRGGFVEVASLAGAGYPDECTLEADDGEGKKLTLHLRGWGCAHAIELSTRIAKELWSTDR